MLFLYQIIFNQILIDIYYKLYVSLYESIDNY